MNFVTKFIAKTVLTVAIPTNRVVVVDCSGSMYSELAKLRQSLKNKLPTLVNPNDSLTLIWFSGKNQFGIVFEDIEIATLTDLSKVNNAIDRFLTPQGATAFLQPIQEAKRAIMASSKQAATLHFMTDGHNNQGSENEIIEACQELFPMVSSATFVEYGYYANHELLVRMAETTSGRVVLAENFSRYEEELRISMSGASGKRISVDVSTGTEFVIGSSQTDFCVSIPKNGKVMLNPDTGMYSEWNSSTKVTSIDNEHHACFVVAALIQKGMIDTAMDVASQIGDIVLFKSIENAFSKQDYMRATDLAIEYGSGKRKLYQVGGKQSNLIPDENAYNILTMLLDLSEEDGNYLDISHPEFEYNPMSGARVTVPVGDGTFVPKFTDKAKQVKGAISAIKFSEDRPNISLLVKREGSVSLPPNEYGFGESFDTFIWRSYTIVADGIVNMSKLPVILAKASFDLLVHNGVLPKTETFKVGKTYVIDTTNMPVINRSMAKPVALTDLFNQQFNLYELQCVQKIINSTIDKPEAGESFSAMYGEDGAKFLKECGISEGGFNPKSTKGEDLDGRIAKVIEIKMSGLATVPKVDDVKKAITSGKKLTPSQEVMKKQILAVDNGLYGEGEAAQKKIRSTVRGYRDDIIMKKFGIILGKKLPLGMCDIDDTTREMDFGLGKKISCELKIYDKVI